MAPTPRSFQPCELEREDAFLELTPRELEVLELIAREFNNSQIAEELEVSDKTVRNHITSIYNMLQVADWLKAIIRAWSAGMGD